MAIKLYKSSLTPTVKTSNVEDRRQISLTEAQSVGKAMKGMLHSGEKLYTKHLDIKSDNELLEKSKEIMNGKDDQEGLSAVSLQAKAMKDPDKAIALYNEKWKSLLETSKNEVSWMAKKKLSSWMNRQNLKDTNAIKIAATTNMLDALKVNITDKIENLKKSIIFSVPGSLEQNTAKQELKTLLSEKKTIELFGASLDKIRKDTETEIAFFRYKNVAIADQAKALEMAKKDKRISNDDGKYSYNKLKLAFETANASNNHINQANVKKMASNLENGIWFNQEEFNNAVTIATASKDSKTLIKLKQIAEDAPIYAALTMSTTAEIEARQLNLMAYNNANPEGINLKEAKWLEISKKYLAALTTSLDKDQLMTAHDKGIVTLQEIDFSKMLITEDIADFTMNVDNRIAHAKTVAAFYNRKVKFFTTNERKAIESEFANAQTSDRIIQLSTVLVKAFGVESNLAFKEISKDNTFLSHIGGLTLDNGGVASPAVELAAEGYLLSKKPELSKAYLVKSTDPNAISVFNKYENAFNENPGTFNNVVEAANYIYAAQLRKKGKTVDDFNSTDYKKAFEMAAGATHTDIWGSNKYFSKNGGFDEDTRGNMVWIPPWVENGKFGDIIERLKSDEKLWLKASSNGQNGVIGDGSKLGEEITLSEIFKERDPYFVGVGNGKYIIAMGEDPTEEEAEPEYVMNSDGGFFTINLNLIRNEIITGLN